MLRRPLRNALILSLVLPLASFRMPTSDQSEGRLIYDVRGAFVTARPDVPETLVQEVDALVDVAIRATLRSSMLPRTILSVRLSEVSASSAFLGTRHSARVLVQAVSVTSGEPVAEGSFTTSVFLFDRQHAEHALAEKIAERITGEFRLNAAGHGSLATALRE